MVIRVLFSDLTGKYFSLSVKRMLAVGFSYIAMFVILICKVCGNLHVILEN